MARPSHVPTGSRSRVERLAEFFGDRLLAEITETLCREYVDWRCAQTDKRATKSKGRTIKPTTARRELVTLSAALNWCFRNKHLGRPTVVMLPKVAKRRERYLPRVRRSPRCCGPRSASTAMAPATASVSTGTLLASS